MCSNYRPVTATTRLFQFFNAQGSTSRPDADVYPLGLAPFLHLTHEGTEGGRGELIVEDGQFGLLPHFSPDVKYGRRTYNARSETVARLASFRSAWEQGQRCIIPAEAIYEPSYESGEAVRWRIATADGEPMGIAGIYRRWKNPAGGELGSFSMLTVNADDHPLMKRFHAPGDEKRMVVILPPGNYEAWLACPVQQASSFFRQWHGPLHAEPAPRERAAAKPASEPVSNPGELF